MPSRPPIFRAPGWQPAPRKRPQVQEAYYGSAEWKRLRKACWERDGYRCTSEHCTTPDRGFGGRVIADHIIPRREGGEDALPNLRTLCPACDNRRHRKRGVLTEADGMALVGLCEAYADLLAARESLSRPLTMDTEGGSMIFAEGGERYYWTMGKGGPMRRQRPEIADIADADRRFAAWLAKFGLTPADRTRVAGKLPDSGGGAVGHGVDRCRRTGEAARGGGGAAEAGE